MRRGLADALETAVSFARCRYAPPPASRAALERAQQRRVVRLLRHVLPRSPYYRALFARVGGDARRWREIAVTDKAALMAHFSRLNTAGVDRDRALSLALAADRSRDFTPKLDGLTVGLSSGTSGHRGLFLASQAENNRWAGVALAKMLPGQLWHTHRIALLHRANSHLYQGLGSGRLQFRHFDLLQPWSELLQAVERYRPTVLIAPPSALWLLAESRALGKLALPAPRRLVSVAEVLEPAQRAYIERAFGVRVDIAYVATEGFIASTCARGGLHLNEDLLVVERAWIGGSRRVFTPIITDLHRRVVPIIRYRLDDVLSLAETSCPCGSPHATLEAIQGRHDDLFRFGERAVFPDFIRSAVMQSSPDILDYEVVQTGPDLIEARLAVADAALSQADVITAALCGELARIAGALAAPTPRLIVELAPARPRPLTAAKVRRVRSQLPAAS